MNNWRQILSWSEVDSDSYVGWLVKETNVVDEYRREPNYLLAVEKYERNGIKEFLLYSGYTEEDALFRYKQRLYGEWLSKEYLDKNTIRIKKIF